MLSSCAQLKRIDEAEHKQPIEKKVRPKKLIPGAELFSYFWIAR